MKKRIKLFVTCLLISCSNDDSQNFNKELKSIFGQWRLVNIGSEENPNQFIEPASENGIFICFCEENSLVGATSSNSFRGEYTLDKNRVVIHELTSTLANETEWGNLFKSILLNSSDENEQSITFAYIINEKQLVLQFKNKELMTFIKEESDFKAYTIL